MWQKTLSLQMDQVLLNVCFVRVTIGRITVEWLRILTSSKKVLEKINVFSVWILIMWGVIVLNRKNFLIGKVCIVRQLYATAKGTSETKLRLMIVLWIFIQFILNLLVSSIYQPLRIFWKIWTSKKFVLQLCLIKDYLNLRDSESENNLAAGAYMHRKNFCFYICKQGIDFKNLERVSVHLKNS